jgi:hypothetical protein
MANAQIGLADVDAAGVVMRRSGAADRLPRRGGAQRVDKRQPLAVTGDAGARREGPAALSRLLFLAGSPRLGPALPACPAIDLVEDVLRDRGGSGVEQDVVEIEVVEAAAVVVRPVGLGLAAVGLRFGWGGCLALRYAGGALSAA